MSVVVQNKNGWLLDPCSLIDRGISKCIRWRGGRNQDIKCCFRRQCFDSLKRPYGSKNPNVHLDNGAKDDSLSKASRKRKRKHVDLNQGEIDALAAHEKVRSFILEGTKCLVEAARPLGYLDALSREAEEEEPIPNPDCNLAALCDMAKQLPPAEAQGTDDGDDEVDVPVQFLPAEGVRSTSHLDLFSKITENNADSAVAVTLLGADYIIPQRTSFLLSDFTRIHPLVHYGKKFDLIVVDPPWENKSVKRSGRYSSLPSTQLKQLPVPLLAAPGCLVVTWVTNKPSLLRFVRDQLYPHWGVKVVAEWFWVKVTTAGEYVFPLDSPHKKPYEVLLLGRYAPPPPSPLHPPSPSPAASAPPPPPTSTPHPPSPPHPDPPPPSDGPQRSRRSRENIEELPVDQYRLIVSVPSVFHSQKPSLSEVLRPYVGQGARCLELFARALQPGWTSWGNEVLKFQHAAYHRLTSPDDDDSGDDPPAEPSRGDLQATGPAPFPRDPSHAPPSPTGS